MDEIQVQDLKFRKCYDRQTILKRVSEVAGEVNKYYA